MNKLLEGKGVLITGGASGFGKGIGLGLARKGADLILVDNNKETLEPTSSEDVVKLAIFLASPASDFITGYNFPIDGGIVDIDVPAWYLKSDI